MAYEIFDEIKEASTMLDLQPGEVMKKVERYQTIQVFWPISPKRTKTLTVIATCFAVKGQAMEFLMHAIATRGVVYTWQEEGHYKWLTLGITLENAKAIVVLPQIGKKMPPEQIEIEPKTQLRTIKN